MLAFPCSIAKANLPPGLPESPLTEIHVQVRHSSNYIIGISIFITSEGIVKAVEEYLLSTPLITFSDWCFPVPSYSHHPVKGSWPVRTFLGTVRPHIPYFHGLAPDFFWLCRKSRDTWDMFFVKSKAAPTCADIYPPSKAWRHFLTFSPRRFSSLPALFMTCLVNWALMLILVENVLWDFYFCIFL